MVIGNTYKSSIKLKDKSNKNNYKYDNILYINCDIKNVKHGRVELKCSCIFELKLLSI